MDVNRRNFLKGTAAGAAGTALAGGVLIGGAHADANARHRAAAARSRRRPTRSTAANQSGVLTPGPSGKQAFTCVAAFDSMAPDKAALADLLQTITTRARFLTAGGTPPNLGIGQPPSDSDVLGPVVPADGLTVTLSVGSTLFDDRYGLGRHQAAEAQADDRLPERLARPRVAARRPARAVLREPPGHDPPRDQGHHQAHPRRHAAALEDGGLQLTAPPVRARRGTCSASRTAPPTRRAPSPAT